MLFRAKLTVKETVKGHKFYDHDLTEIEKPAGQNPDATLPKAGVVQGGPAGQSIKLSDLLAGVNRDSDGVVHHFEILGL